MSEEDKVQKFFKAYLTQTKIKQDFAQRIIKQAESYDTKHRPKQFLDKFFDTLKKCYDPKNPKNFVTTCKRFLFIINKLLGSEVKKEKQGKYNQLISQQIVRYYLFFFEIIFKNSLHELIVDLKMYRMKWVRLISDSAFINLREEIMKKHNKFNLDRGFSEQNMQKLKKIHHKRGLTAKQSNFYLGLEEKEQLHQVSIERNSNESSNSSSDQSENQYENKQKKIKTDYNMSNTLNYQIPGYSTYSYQQGYMDNSSPYDSQTYQNYVDPRIMRLPFNQNGFNSNIKSLPNNTYFNEKVPLEETPQTNPSLHSYSPLPSNSSYYPYQNYPLLPEASKSIKTHEFKEVAEQRRPQSNLFKINKIRKQLQKNLFKCRQCGQCFETGQNHEKHMNDHFFASLEKVNEAEIKGKTKKEVKTKLLDLKTWESVQKSNEKQYRFEVLLSQIPDQKGEKVFCYFCNEELEMSFSGKYEDWVLSDAIKITDEGKVNIIHFGCYESFKSDQNSSVSN